jgi:hypothetical protein
MTASPRPAPELLARLREGKRAHHEAQRALPLPEKVRRVIALQRLAIPLIARRRHLEPWERPWPEADE